MRFRLNDKDVVSEVLDGEVIAIHFQTGAYYSMLESGAHIWNALLDGWSADEIIDRLAASAKAERERIGTDVAGFVTRLLAENLLVKLEGEVGGRGKLPAFGEYAAPKLDKYTDMQELLLVDPIHEVSEEGWPLRAETKM